MYYKPPILTAAVGSRDKLMKQIIKWILLIALLYPNLALPDIAVIVNVDNTTGSISPIELKNIYRVRLAHFANGDPIHLSYQPANRKTTQQLLDSIVGRSMSKLNRYWAAQIFSGRMEPPKKLENDALVIEWISLNKNGIGYINSKNLADSVKQVATIESETADAL